MSTFQDISTKSARLYSAPLNTMMKFGDVSGQVSGVTQCCKTLLFGLTQLGTEKEKHQEYVINCKYVYVCNGGCCAFSLI